ncbi:universal stress protein [Streptomyces sp. NPDC003077]|uniref:universal stress protein n=1 Tax=Streptomyces sp. NPDC003077 TaxID=3154443 RepID=UPI0033BE0812
MPGRIAVGLDGSRESLAAADWAAREARRRGLPLRLLHAWEGLGPADRGEPALPELAVPRERARDILREAERYLAPRYPGLPLTAEAVARSPVDALRAAADTDELLVIGSRGLGGVAGFLVGSVALATVAHAGRPVVLVRAGERATDEHLPGATGEPSTDTPHREVLVGLDPGTGADVLLEFAFTAAAVRGAPLRVLHIWGPPPHAGLPRRHPAHAGAGGDAGDDAGAEARHAVAAALRPWREKFPDQRVTEEVTGGRAAPALLEAAARAGLVVIGRRVRHTAVGPHLGRVAHMVVHHTLCPVAVVPHD